MNTVNESAGALTERIRWAARLAAHCRRMIASTGAGISRESGIPALRDEAGLWMRRRPEELATREAFLSNPPLVWKWCRERLAEARRMKPNPGHVSLVELESLVPSFLLITQNVDSLERRAGTKELVELHGALERYRCFDYGHPVPEDPSWGDEPPRCRCGSLVRPDVVWCGEPPPQAELECAFRESQKCDLFLLVGASEAVQPASLLPAIAKQAGAKLIEVNSTTSETTPIADLLLEGKASEILPALVDEIKKVLGEKR